MYSTAQYAVLNKFTIQVLRTWVRAGARTGALSFFMLEPHKHGAWCGSGFGSGSGPFPLAYIVEKSKVYIKFLIFLHYIGQRISVVAGVGATVGVGSPVGVGAAVGVRAAVGATSFWCSSGTKYSTVKLQILYCTCQNAWYSEKNSLKLY
jgi:hypothetical protein